MEEFKRSRGIMKLFLNDKVLEFLEMTLSKGAINCTLLKDFQNYVFNADKISENPNIEAIIRELAYDLDYFEADERLRKEDPSFFGESKALEIVKDAYDQINS
ncbi:MAG: hypothetical protein ACM3SY_09120, partial [Candidatus Omnitrophota bacterium]